MNMKRIITILIAAGLVLAIQTITAFASAQEKVIAHGGGVYRGYETTNSVEALTNSIANGFQIVELDMALSSDEKIIMLHDWDKTAEYYYGVNFKKKLSLNQFKHLKVHGELEVLTFEKLVPILKKNPDIRIITDIKEDNLRLLSLIADQYPGFEDRFIPQIYDFEEWNKVKELGYKDIILTLYAMEKPDADEVSAFVKAHPVYGVAMPDYMAEKGLCNQLSDQGIIIYVHPISDYEDALHFIGMGAYGVYSGSLLPEEFAGIEEKYYLTVSGSEGSEDKLTDSGFESLADLNLCGLKQGDSVIYEVDGISRYASSAAILSDIDDQMDGSDLNELSDGKHEFKVTIVNQEAKKGSLTYYLWKDAAGLRIVHKKYEYRLDSLRQKKDFDTVMQEKNIPAEVGDILSRSFIAKTGESTYYAEGTPGSFMNDGELLDVQKSFLGKAMLPVADTILELGADSVFMDHQRYITIAYKGEQIMAMPDAGFIRKDFRINRMNTKVALYLNKAMAEGEFFKLVAGRNSVEKDGVIVILPVGMRADTELKNRLPEAACQLY